MVFQISREIPIFVGIRIVMYMRIYRKPEISELEADVLQVLCDSLTGTDIDDFTQSEDIDW